MQELRAPAIASNIDVLAEGEHEHRVSARASILMFLLKKNMNLEPQLEHQY